MFKQMPSRVVFSTLILYILTTFFYCTDVLAKKKISKKEKMTESTNENKKSSDYEEYIAFFEEVYKTVEDNYYQPIKRENFSRFINQFDAKIYPQLKGSGKSIDYIRWRSAAFLIDFLKSEEDVFSAFYPPEPAKEYEQTSLGKRIDLGIEGKVTDEGWKISFIEPRSDAYIRGLRIHDIIKKIDGLDLIQVDEAKRSELLNPLADKEVKISYYSHAHKKESEVTVSPKEYFKQTVFDVPVPVPNIYCLKIDRFNRKTSDDLFYYLEYYKRKGDIKGLILDLRGNPGGPPLAAREIASFFLPAGSEFTYFKQKDTIKASLDVPKIPEKYHYNGPIVILINKQSGSAAELFSGVLQRQGRAVLMGTNSAGQVMLKSMFHFKDESMVLLVTARGHHPDGHVFSFSGLIPEKRIEENEETQMLKYAATYLVYEDMRKNQVQGKSL